MTHYPEESIERSVADWFREQYGSGNVVTQLYQPTTRWYCDIVVDTEWATLFVEVENDERSVRPGLAQALGYAGQDPVGGIAMVVTPAGHLDKERVSRLRRGPVLIREFDTQTNEFVNP